MLVIITFDSSEITLLIIKQNGETDKSIRKSGVFIVTKTKYLNIITRINRINGSMAELRFKTDSKIKNLSIINTYDPHHGYDINHKNIFGL